VGNFVVLTNNFTIMKKLLFLLATILFCGCSESFEEFAKKRAVEYVNERTNTYAKEKGIAIKSLNIEQPQVIYSSDSICMITCKLSVHEYGGEKESTVMGYVILKDLFQTKIEKRNIYYEYSEDQGVSGSLYDRYLEYYNETSGSGLNASSFYEFMIGIKKYFTEVPTK
jgi:hypothetical protein